jgi:putative sigma-54 modulation protein
MYVSVDKAVHKLQAQIRRWKDRIQDHHSKSVSMVDMQVNVLQRPYDGLDEINAQIEEANLNKEISEYRPPRIIGTESRPLKTLTVDEAVMKMDLSGDHFLLFRSEEDRKLKLIYRRSDNNFGMIILEAC